MASYDGPIIDVDVHNGPRSEADIKAYLPERWKDYLPIYPPHTPDALLTGSFARRADTWGPDGAFPGTDPGMLKKQLLDPFNYVSATLTHDLGHFPGLSNPFYMKEVVRASNEWMVERWLDEDDRLHGVIVAPLSLPEEAVAEVHRYADHPRMVGVLISSNPLRRPLGDALFHPMYAAAQERGLIISVHNEAGGVKDASGTKTTPPTLDGGSAQLGMHYISSLIVNGVFEKFPNLKFVIKEYGISWLPWVMWRLDEMYSRLREESPWVKDLPSNYIRRNIKLSTQPIEAGARPNDLIDYLSVIDGIEDLLCYSSDYPHGTMDDPLYVARILPESWRRKVMCDNACDLYGWDRPPAGADATPRPVAA